MDADPMHQLVIDEELRRAEVTRPNNPIGIGLHLKSSGGRP